MTALEKLEAALREHAAGVARQRTQQDRNRRLNDARWRDNLHRMELDSDGWSYATKARWLRQARENGL